MSRWKHCLTDINLKTLEAVCSECGRTGILIYHNGDAVCAKWRNDDIEAYYINSPRVKAIEILGCRCVKCGFDDWRALQIDHKIGHGGNRKSAHIIYEEIILGQTDPYQLLCANCNRIKALVYNETQHLYGYKSWSVRNSMG